MRIIAVTRLFNEADIVEPFVRHHAALVDRHILLDNGSTDRSLAILGALRQEGFDLAVFRNASPVYAEPIYNTALLRAALEDGADWVVFLDCDEFIDDREAGGLRAALARATSDAVELSWITYLAATPTSRSAANWVEALVLRHAAPTPRAKVAVRRHAGPARLSIGAGGHFLVRAGEPVASPALPGVRLAHYPERSAAQVAVKAVIGRLKVLATGAEGAASDWSAHYTAAFEALRDDPLAWFAAAARGLAARDHDPSLLLDPLPYRGGPLRHTAPVDDLARALSLALRHAEALAGAHGRLIATPEAGRRMLAEASAFERLI